MSKKRPPAKEVRTFVVDAFTQRPWRGNPAAVCLMEGPAPDTLLQSIAAEFNLAETAFVWAVGSEGALPGTRRLRWFTPAVEVDLCGHATLATAHVLLHEQGSIEQEVRFHTRSGTLSARRAQGDIVLDFPAEVPMPIPPPPSVIAALGVKEVQEAAHAPLRRKLLLCLRNEEQVRTLRPDLAALRSLRLDPPTLGVIVTAPGSGGVDFVSRYFAPWVGIDEDPVTGSAHTVLGPYWAAKLGRQRLFAHQCSARGGEMQVMVRPDGRVDLLGSAVVVSSGVLRLPDGAGRS